MPQIILGPQQHAPQIDGSVKGKAYNFLAKLSESDALPGLHIEPIVQAVDSRVRTGRVDDFWRAVMFKVQGQGQEALYIYLGVWPHDAASEFAMKAGQLYLYTQVAEPNAICKSTHANKTIANSLNGVAESCARQVPTATAQINAANPMATTT